MGIIKNIIKDTFIIISLVVCSCSPQEELIINSKTINSPILALKQINESISLKIVKETSANEIVLNKISLNICASESLKDIRSIQLLDSCKSVLATTNLNTNKTEQKITLNIDQPLKVQSIDTLSLSISIQTNDSINLNNKILVKPLYAITNKGKNKINNNNLIKLDVGVAVWKQMQDNIAARIPGITTTKNGTLIAIYDGRIGGYRDLQGNMDICVQRSTDKGATWSKPIRAIDMGEWGGLPEKFNGVSDGCILVDDNSGDIYIAGLWMHGVLNPKTGKWIKNLSDTSTVWNHQWKTRGSQPGYDVKESSQFMIVKSTDDGLTWSRPINITKQVKNKKWWLLAPAPGHGITLEDGTLVFPTEGRLEDGLQFSTITYSKDNGKTWITGNPAYTNTNECMAVQLDNGSIMLNMRERSNRGKVDGNGRAIAVTKDMGNTWTEHSTSRKDLIEPACMASIHKHYYTNPEGKKRTILFFFNPSSTNRRDNFTLKCSLDNGETWPTEYWKQLDEQNGNGYSCITSIDNETIGILYEGSGADLVFQQIKINEIIK